MSEYFCAGTALFVGAFWVWLILDNRRQAVEIMKMEYRLDRLDFLLDCKQENKQHTPGGQGESDE